MIEQNRHLLKEFNEQEKVELPKTERYYLYVLDNFSTLEGEFENPQSINTILNPSYALENLLQIKTPAKHTATLTFLI